MKTLRRTPLSLALFAAFTAGQCGLATASLLSLSQVPLFVTTAQKANVLLIYANSNAMDEDATGMAVGSAAPTSKSEISRTAARTLVTNYLGKINMGLMAYQQSGVAHNWLNPSTYDASFDPANYDPAWAGARDSATHKKFKLPNPTSPNAAGACTTSNGVKVDCIYYNVNLPYYSGSPAGNSFCYSAANGNSGYASFPGDHTGYACYGTKTGTSDAAPPDAGYGAFQFNGTFGPTESDYAQAIDDFGQRLTSYDVGPTWFSNSSPGQGYLHVPVAKLDAAQAGKLNVKLATSVVPTRSNAGVWNDNPTAIAGGNTPTNPNAPLINAGLSPITGTFMTAKDYFNGNTTNFQAAQGGPQAVPPNACGKDFAVFLTNGLPSVTSNGHPMGAADYVPGQPFAAAEVANAVTAVSNLKNGTRPVKTYVIGFALPEFTNNYFVNHPPNPLNQMADAGGTSSAFFADDLTTLNATFKSIFDDILAQSGAAAAVALTSGSVIAGGKIYQGQFNSSDWSGDLVSYNTDPTTGEATGVAWHAGGDKTKSSVLDTQNYDTGRNIVTFKPSNQRGIPFRWPVDPANPAATELDMSQSTALNTNISNVDDGLGQNRLDFIRGKTGIAGFRARTLSVLGDLVNSAPAYVGAPAFNYPDWLESVKYSTFRYSNKDRTPILYVGANDGMLHGFDATTGQEKIAYVPSGVYGNLSSLTSPSYAHRYFVDGSPALGDTFYGGAWHTTLVSSLGAGGQSVFALDVTDPANFSESNAGALVRWEFSDPDLGYFYGQPSIVKLNNGKWAAVFGNGYNNSEADGTASTTGYAYLFIVDVETGALIRKISTGAGSVATPNALAEPALVDMDGDGKVDVAYAGDLQGNLWKFDLCKDSGSGCSVNPADWGVALSGSPLFVARDAGNNPQPITGAIETTRYFSGDGNQLFFGTGKFLENTDIATNGTQTFYSIWDKANEPSAISGRGELQQQTVDTITTANGRVYRKTSANTIDWASQRGWYLDLPDSGERIVTAPAIISGRILFTTLIPGSGECSNGGTGWLMELDAVTGGKLGAPTFDVNGDGKIDEADYVGTSGSYGSGVKTTSIPSTVRLQKNPGGPGGGTLNKILSVSKVDLTAAVAGALEIDKNKLPSSQKRTSWRQIFE